jgi:hypothetical protein
MSWIRKRTSQALLDAQARNPTAMSGANILIGTVSAQGSTGWVLIRRRNASCRRTMTLVLRVDIHCDGSRPAKVKRRSPGLFQTVGSHFALEAPLAQDGLPLLFEIRGRFGKNHVAIIVPQFLVHVLRRMRPYRSHAGALVHRGGSFRSRR